MVIPFRLIQNIERGKLPVPFPECKNCHYTQTKQGQDSSYNRTQKTIRKKVKGKKEGSLINTDANPLETVIIQTPTGYDITNPRWIKQGFYKGCNDSSPLTNQYM